MFQINLKKGFIRSFVLLLSFVLLFCFVSRPMTAHAAVVEGGVVALGVGGQVVSVAVYLLPIILILVGVGVVSDDINYYRNRAQEIYNNGSSALRNWCNDVAQQIIDGTSAFKLNSTVVSEVNSKLGSNNKVPNDKKYLLLPPDLYNLTSYSTDELLLPDITGIMEENNSLLTDIKGGLNTLKTATMNVASGVASALVPAFNSVTTSVQNLQAKVESFGFKLWEAIGNVGSLIQSMSISLQTDLGIVIRNMSDMSLDLLEGLGIIRNNIRDMSLSLQKDLGMVISNIRDMSISLQTDFGIVVDRLDQVLEVITAPQSVTKPQIEVQAGAQTVVVSDYASMGKAFSAKMGWLPQIFDFLAELRERLYEGTAPKVAIDLSDAEGSYNYGGRVYILDMTWYARYKPYVDTILSGIMWLCFGWALYKRIPDILSGVGMTVENATETRGHVWSDRAERSESLSYRQQRREDYYKKHGRR